MASGCGLRGCDHRPWFGAGTREVGWHGVEERGCGLFLVLSLERVEGKGRLEGLAHQLTQLIRLRVSE